MLPEWGEVMMRTIVVLILGLAVSLPAVADDDWYGIVKRKLDGDSQQWLVGSKPVNLPADSDISTDVGPLDIGACARISGAGDSVEKLGTQAMRYCDKTDYDTYLAQYKAIAEKGGSEGNSATAM